MYCLQGSMSYVSMLTFSPGQTYVALSRSKSLPKLNILSDFDLKIIKPNNSVLEHYEYLREEKNSLTKTALFKKPFVALLNICGMFKKISDLTSYSRLMNITLICLTETSLLSTAVGKSNG